MTRFIRAGVLLVMTSGAVCCGVSSGETEPAGPLPKPERDLSAAVKPGEMRTAVLAGGCFWCMEAVFEQLHGVVNVVSGYAGGTATTAHYVMVSAGATKHAEAVQVSYDPAIISYGTLLRVFFATHHPTQRDGQGPDHGRQYRSAIFYASDQEKAVALAYTRQLEQARLYDKPIVTALEPLEKFYPAEDYHQDYVRQHPAERYVRAWALPKLDKLRRLYPELLKAKAE